MKEFNLRIPDDVCVLMWSSKNIEEWNANCDKVKVVWKGYPPFWYPLIISSGLMSVTIGSFTNKVTTLADFPNTGGGNVIKNRMYTILKVNTLQPRMQNDT